MGEKQKVLYVVEALGGGVFTYIVGLANELVNSCDMYIAYAVRPQTPENYKDYFDKRIHLIEVKDLTRSINGVKDVKAFFEIKRIAARIKPDIIHLHSSKAGVLGRWAFNGRKTRLFYTPHGYSFLMENCSRGGRGIYRLIEWISAKRRCTTISCSEGEHRETLKMTKRAAYVNNGINIEELEEILPPAPEPKEHPTTVFMLGRICDQKNPKLFNTVAKALPGTRFLWIGDGELREELTAPNVEITGWVDRKAALSRALTADIFMLTSLWEGLPISLLESMFMKKLCIVSDVIGNHDVIHSGVNGYICTSAEEFVEALRKSETMGPEIRELVDRAYYDVVHTYNTKAMAKSYMQLYMEGVRVLP